MGTGQKYFLKIHYLAILILKVKWWGIFFRATHNWMCSFSRAQTDWACKFPERTGQNNQNGPDWIWTYISKHVTYHVQIINFYKIRFIDTNLVSKVPRPSKQTKKFLKNNFKTNFDFFLYFFSVLKVRHLWRKMFGFRTVQILKICRTSRVDVMFFWKHENYAL